MRKEILLQNHLKDTFSFMHKKRQCVLFGAVDSLMEGGKLTLTSLGRNFKGKAKERNQIRKMDRLLGNKHLHEEIPHIYKAINAQIMPLTSPVICVDWSCLSYSEGIYLLRASLKIHGRSMVCYQEVHPQEHENNTEAQNRFLDNLHAVLPDNVRPIILTDAIFSTLWFKKIKSLHWDFIGRVRTNRGNYFHNEKWNKVEDAYERATTEPSCLGPVFLTKKNKFPCRLIVYKKILQGRKKKNAKGQLAKGSYEKVQSKGAREPWVLATSLSENNASPKIIVQNYACRMQIEEEFRDSKSSRFGFGLEDSGTRIYARLNVLLIINLLASVFCWVIACATVKKNQHVNYHATSSKKPNLLSAITLGKRVYRKIKLFSVRLFTTAFNYWLKVIKGNVTYGVIL